MYAFGRICLVKMIDVNRSRPMTIGLAAICRQKVNRGDAPLHFHCRSFHTYANLDDVRHRRGDGNRHHHFHDAVQAVVAMKVRLRVTCRYLYTVHLRRDAEQGGK